MITVLSYSLQGTDAADAGFKSNSMKCTHKIIMKVYFLHILECNQQDY